MKEVKIQNIVCWRNHIHKVSKINSLIKIITFAFFALPFFTKIVLSDEILYCSEELATGFDIENGVWNEYSFQKNRFTARFSNDFSILEIRGDIYECYNGGPFLEYHPIICKIEQITSSAAFNYDKTTMRFVRTAVSIGGYVSKDGRDTDSMHAGKCEKF